MCEKISAIFRQINYLAIAILLVKTFCRKVNFRKFNSQTKFFPSNQLFSYSVSKTVVFTNFLSKKSEKISEISAAVRRYYIYREMFSLIFLFFYINFTKDWCLKFISTFEFQNLWKMVGNIPFLFVSAIVHITGLQKQEIVPIFWLNAQVKLSNWKIGRFLLKIRPSTFLAFF